MKGGLLSDYLLIFAYSFMYVCMYVCMYVLVYAYRLGPRSLYPKPKKRPKARHNTSKCHNATPRHAKILLWLPTACTSLWQSMYFVVARG